MNNDLNKTAKDEILMALKKFSTRTEARFDILDATVDRLVTRIDKFEPRIDKLGIRFDKVESSMLTKEYLDHRLTEFSAEIGRYLDK